MVDELKRAGEIELESKGGLVDLTSTYAFGKAPVVIELYPTRVSKTGRHIGKKWKAIIWVEEDEDREEEQ